MGGRAFHNRGLQAPRLAPKLYTSLVTLYQPVLEELYARVVCLPSVWEKPDHGDIDFLVVERDDSSIDPVELADRLGAKAFIVNAPSTSYAVPHPDFTSSSKVIVQIDIRTCPKETFDWQSFTGSYADLGPVLAFLLRPVALKITDKGFFLRVPPSQAYSKGKEDMLLLSNDPEAVMRFLGLDEERFKAGFATEFQVFDFLLSGRLPRPQKLSGGELRKKDRVLVKKRPMFRRFVEDYLSRQGGEHGTEGDGNGDGKGEGEGEGEENEAGKYKWETKEEVKEAALRHFHRQVKYEAMS
ncbi:hypothetical protein HD553DRAFT_318203 [Filobasidium floriforme]|uniref:uncharacterized protein n=1 Tax=Filobasidium floriforme TaxID=5210 RepID=UPI001E8EAB3A|nr:uncharacterized protein HD553DRAFT_318203 [Filobasidium floriforme]KAH8079638.1 hypothetical protein HD553DRAFT_318203 [Filobasidium floriforme]